jgi:hypothetical protein
LISDYIIYIEGENEMNNAAKSTVKKIAAGHYASDKAEVRNVFDGSGAAHTRNARAKWLVTLPSGKTLFVPSLKIAREYYL